MKTTKEDLEKIADVHLNPHAAHLLDCKVLKLDMDKMISRVKGPSVLELGYGDGMWTEKMIEVFGHTHVVDASSKLLSRVKELYQDNVECYESFFEEFSPPDGKRFNTIIATHVFEHIHDPVKVMKRAKSWLAPGGRILIIVPNATSLHRQLAVMMGIQSTVYDFSPRDHEVGHVRVYDFKTLKEDVTTAGYNIVFEQGLFLKILPNSMMTDFSDQLLEALVDISDDMQIELMANLVLVIEVNN